MKVFYLREPDAASSDVPLIVPIESSAFLTTWFHAIEKRSREWNWGTPESGESINLFNTKSREE
jgi:hypothetical protein